MINRLNLSFTCKNRFLNLTAMPLALPTLVGTGSLCGAKRGSRFETMTR
jgi:hypothetical protein